MKLLLCGKCRSKWRRKWVLLLKEKEIGKHVGPDKFLHAHTKAHDGARFVNDRCREIQDKYLQNLTQNEVRETPDEVRQTTEEVSDSLDELEAFYEAAGGVNKDGAIFGLGSAASQYENRYPRNSRASTSSSSVGASSSSASNEIQDMRTTLESV